MLKTTTTSVAFEEHIQLLGLCLLKQQTELNRIDGRLTMVQD